MGNIDNSIDENELITNYFFPDHYFINFKHLTKSLTQPSEFQL